MALCPCALCHVRPCVPVFLAVPHLTPCTFHSAMEGMMSSAAETDILLAWVHSLFIALMHTPMGSLLAQSSPGPTPFYCQVRAYLRQRAGLPPVTVGVGALNLGHTSLFERELLYLNDVLPKNSDVHDGLQLLDGGNPDRHCVATAAAPTAAATAPATPASTPAAPAVVAAAVPVVVGGAPAGVLLPVPLQPMRLEPLPGHVAGRDAHRGPDGTGAAAAARSGDGVGDFDEEEDDEIRPVRDDRAAQWRAYRAAGF